MLEKSTGSVCSILDLEFEVKFEEEVALVERLLTTLFELLWGKMKKNLVKKVEIIPIIQLFQLSRINPCDAHVFVNVLGEVLLLFFCLGFNPACPNEAVELGYKPLALSRGSYLLALPLPEAGRVLSCQVGTSPTRQDGYYHYSWL